MNTTASPSSLVSSFSAISLLATAAALSTVCGLANAASSVVGTATLPITDTPRGRALTTEIWFEAAAGAQAADFSPLLPIAAIQIARNATPAPAAQRPLIVISHGNWGTRFSQGWLARTLVQAGYVVVSPSHPGTMNDDRTLAGSVRLWDRSADVKVVLDRLLQDPQWAGLIDADRIGFFGHSFGGWTGVSLAGGRYDMQSQIAGCQAQQPKDMYCDGWAKEDISAVSMKGAEADYRDARIKAFYLAATGPGSSMTLPSLQNIRVPMTFDTARFDDVLAPKENAHFLATAIPGASEITRDVGHFSYVPVCKPFIGAMVAKLICSDPASVNRAELHRAVGQAVVGFFDKTLGRPTAVAGP
jgi:predicted dienelactone hydrolase